VVDEGEEPPDLPPIDIYYSSHPNIRLRTCDNSAKGKGLFAIAKINQGEVIWKHQPDPHGRMTAKIYTKEEVDDFWKDDLDWFFHWAYRCGEDKYLGPLTKDCPDREATYFQNHSCDPTTWWVDETTLTAIRDIEPGEEITFDYATSESTEDECGFIRCLCESSNCRKEIKGDDYLRPELIEKYGDHFQPYLLERIRKMGDIAQQADVSTIPERDI